MLLHSNIFQFLQITVQRKLFDFSPGARGSLHNVKFLLCLSLKIGVLKVFSIMVTSPGIKGAKFHYKYAETVTKI